MARWPLSPCERLKPTSVQHPTWYTTERQDLEPGEKQRMPQHPTRHHTPAHHRGSRCHLQFKRLLASNAYSLFGADAFSCARVLVGHLQQIQTATAVAGDGPAAP